MESTDFGQSPTLTLMQPPPPGQRPLRGGMFVSMGGPPRAHQYCPKSRVYPGVYSCCCTSCRFFEENILCYNMVQSVFTALRILWPLPVHPSFSLTLATTDLFTVSIRLPFSRMSSSWNHKWNHKKKPVRFFFFQLW